MKKVNMNKDINQNKEIKKKPNILSNKDFILLFLGGLVSKIGNGIHYIALVWFVLELTGSGTATGMLLLLSTLPGVLLGPIGGVIADRFNRKLLIVGMDVVRGLIAVWLGWTVYTGVAGFYQLAVATVLMAVSAAFFNPAVSATFPNLVDDRNLQQANSLNHFSFSISQVIGSAIGGVLIALTGIAGVFFINGISFLISAFSELFINIPPVHSGEGSEAKVSILADLKFGASYIINQKDIFSLFLLVIVLNFLATGLFMVGLPFVFKEVLKVNSNLFGIAQSLFPAGAIIGSLILSFSGEIKRYYRVLVTTFGLESGLMILLGIPILPAVLANNSAYNVYLVILAVLFITGIVNAIVNVPIMVLLQRLIPDDLRGRVFGLLGTLSQGLVPISIALTGFLLDFVPAYSIFILSGILSLAFTLYSTRIESFQKLGVSSPKNVVAEKLG